MFRLRIFFLTCLVLVLVGANDTFANFRVAKIITDTCDFSTKLKTMTVSFLKCAFRCGRFMECRRFLYYKTTMKCRLFLDGNNCLVKGDSSGYRCFIKSFGCVADNCTCPWGYYGDKCTQIATDCRDYKEKGYTRLRRVLTTIHPVNSTRPFEVSCYLNLVGSMVIFERDSSCSMQNFNRSLHDYEIGFGNVPWNGWLGFDKIFQTSKPTMALHVILKYASGLSCEVKYRYFSIGNKSSQYTFHADRIQTNTIDFCGDSIMGGNGTLELTGRPFSTFDSDLTGVNCPAILGGGWWFANSSNCSDSFVTGSEMKDNFWRNLLQDQYISKVVFKISYY